MGGILCESAGLPVDLTLCVFYVRQLGCQLAKRFCFFYHLDGSRSTTWFLHTLGFCVTSFGFGAFPNDCQGRGSVVTLKGLISALVSMSFGFGAFPNDCHRKKKMTFRRPDVERSDFRTGLHVFRLWSFPE